MAKTNRYDEISPESVMLFAQNVDAPQAYSKVVENTSETRKGRPSSHEDPAPPPMAGSPRGTPAVEGGSSGSKDRPAAP
eukprot:2660938-Heterocapsa_arctica.AAC.1